MHKNNNELIEYIKRKYVCLISSAYQSGIQVYRVSYVETTRLTNSSIGINRWYLPKRPDGTYRIYAIHLPLLERLTTMHSRSTDLGRALFLPPNRLCSLEAGFKDNSFSELPVQDQLSLKLYEAGQWIYNNCARCISG